MIFRHLRGNNSQVQEAHIFQVFGFVGCQLQQNLRTNENVILVLTGQELLKYLSGNLNKFDGDFSRAVIGHHIQKLRELIVVFEVLNEFILHFRGKLDSDHHNEVLPGHVGLEVAESLWKSLEYLLPIFLQMNSNRFHVILDLSLKDQRVLGHEIVLEADLIGMGQVLGAFLIEGQLQLQILLIGQGMRDVSFFEVEALVLVVLKGVVSEELHVTEVKSAFHFFGGLLYQNIIKSMIQPWVIRSKYHRTFFIFRGNGRQCRARLHWAAATQQPWAGALFVTDVNGKREK